MSDTIEDVVKLVTNLSITVCMDVSVFREWCEGEYDMTNNEWHKKVWRSEGGLSDSFMHGGAYVWFQKVESDELTLAQEMMNDFLDTHPELGGNAKLMFTD